MKNILFLFFIVYSICSISCSGNSSYKNLKAKDAKEQTIKFSVEDVRIPIDSLSYPSYSIYQNIIIDGESYLAGYNTRMHSIDIFNLDTKSFSRHIKIELQGPNEIGNLDGFCIQSWDSIFIYSLGKLYLMDDSGSINWSLNMMKLKPTNGEPGTLASTIGFGLNFSKNRNSVFFNFIPRNVEFGTKEFYSLPFIAEFHLDNNSLTLLPVKYSDYFVNNYTGYLSVPNFSFFNDRIYYCFSGESNIYSYDLNTNETNIYGGRSKFTKSLAESIPRNSTFDQKLRHRLTSATFFNITYDPFRDIFYRLHYGNLDYSISNETNNTFNDKSLYLMIFNKEFELLEEIKLDNYTYLPEFCGISEEGLFLNSNHEMNEKFSADYSNFKLFKIFWESNP